MSDTDDTSSVGDASERWLRARRESGRGAVGEVLSQTEVDTLIEVFIEGNGPSTEEQIIAFVRWAERARIDEAMLILVLQRRVLPFINPQSGTLTFKAK